MRLLFLGINYSPELTGIGKYSGEMAPWLAESSGHDVRVIAAPPYYPAWKLGRGYSALRFMRERISGVDVIRCPLYVPSALNTVKRIIHLMSFSLSSALALAGQILWRPQVVIVVVPAFFCAPFAWIFSRICGARCVIHIQDYELDAMLGLGMGRSGFMASFAARTERFILRRFDRVSTISRSMMSKAEEKGVDAEKIVFFPNWVDTDFITPQADKSRFRETWGISPQQKVVLYSGNIGAKQGLELVLEAAAAMQEEGTSNVLFVVVGQGAYRSTLESMAEALQLTNIQYHDLVAYEDLPDLMVMPDVHLVVQRCGAADVVLPSKLTGILSAGGHALITAEPHTELGLLCANFPGIAECVEPENLAEFLKGLKNLLAKDARQYNTVAREYALRFLNRGAVLGQFNDELCRLAVSK